MTHQGRERTWYVLSKLSYMKRVISEVLPTVVHTASNDKRCARLNRDARTAGLAKEHKLELSERVVEVAGSHDAHLEEK